MDEKEFEQMVQKVSALEGVISAYVCSRAGNFVSGNTPKFADRNMYAAITSLAYGTAEQVGNEMNDNLRYVSLRFSEKNLLVVAMGPRHLLGLLIDGRADQEQVLNKVRPFIT
ncbi:MAG TPA: roadblock/LC7 domain-containing protein [Methanomassiliicoccales archaeon]|nr:roadblock/LC7 domain-containing protein [Methanomassiliicoccales archaeon]